MASNGTPMLSGEAARLLEARAVDDASLGLSRQGALIDTVTAGVCRLIGAPSVLEALPAVLEQLAAVIHLDRVVLAELQTPGAVRAVSLRTVFLWQAPEIPTVDAEHWLEQALLQQELAVWLQPLNVGQNALLTRRCAEPAVRTLLGRAGVMAALVAPVRVEGRTWGHLCFDDCCDDRGWPMPDLQMLGMLAGVIGAALTRERHVKALAAADTILQNSSTVVYRLRGEPALPMTYVSHNIRLLGHEPAAWLDEPISYRRFIHEQDRPSVEEALSALLLPEASPTLLEFRLLTSSGELRWVENRLRPVCNEQGTLLEIEGILIDVTERRVAQDKIATLARSDSLTGLANRSTFQDRLHQAFAASQRGAHAFAVLYLDLDRFKEVNDTLGHHSGDLLLQQVAERLRQATRETDVVARLGGDEFAILQAEVGDSSSAGTLAEKIIEVIGAPYQIEGNELRVGVSIGIAVFSAELLSAETLLAQADQALYRAKQAGRGRYRFHSDQIDQETRAQLALADGLRSAIERCELELRYQPQVELASGRIVGMEALLRWNHPSRGVLLPEDFLPIAERFGIMQQVGRWVLDATCRQMAIWREHHMPVPVVAVNVALAQIRMGREFVRDVVDSIERWGLKPSDLELDVTELVLARSMLAHNGVLEELRQFGVSIAIDDFGAQYSSLDYLRTYRVSRLKIARGMVAAADVEPGGGAMIRAILSLARELGVEVVAEGVETESQCRLLVNASASAQGQGFYYSQAVSAEESLQMLRSGVVRHP